MRIDQVDLWGPKLASVCGGVAGAVGTGVAMLADIVTQLFGVPLPVVVASAAAQGVARGYMDPVSFWRALVASASWVALGCAAAPGVQAILQAAAPVIGQPGLALPNNALAVVAAAVASAPAWWKKVWPIVGPRLGFRVTEAAPSASPPPTDSNNGKGAP